MNKKELSTWFFNKLLNSYKYSQIHISINHLLSDVIKFEESNQPRSLSDNFELKSYKSGSWNLSNIKMSNPNTINMNIISCDYYNMNLILTDPTKLKIL